MSLKVENTEKYKIFQFPAQFAQVKQLRYARKLFFYKNIDFFLIINNNRR